MASIITKARIEIAAGTESLSVGGRKITKHKPITTSDRAEIKFWQNQVPRVTVTALEKAKVVAPKPAPKQPEVPAPKIEAPAPTKSSAPAEAPPISFVSWSATDSIDKLREAARSRDIAFGDADSKNTLIAQLADFDAEMSDGDEESDDNED